MKTTDIIDLTCKDIDGISRLAEQHGGDIISCYLYGDRTKGEIVWVKENSRNWRQCFEYPWRISTFSWCEFYIGADPNDSN